MWYYKNEIMNEENIPEKMVGFIYLITNLSNGRKYIGQKKLSKKVTKTLVKRDKQGNIVKDKDGKSVKVKKKVVASSDWETYFGSSEHLKKDVVELGADKFKREILYFCETKAMMNYIETYLQFKYNVIFDDLYYNGILNCRISTSQLAKVDKTFLNEMEKIKI